MSSNKTKDLPKDKKDEQFEISRKIIIAAVIMAVVLTAVIVTFATRSAQTIAFYGLNDSQISGIKTIIDKITEKENVKFEYIIYDSDKRLEKSRQLLSETNLSIKEITAEIGYNDQNYFSRIFKSKYGLSPKEYRKVK